MNLSRTRTVLPKAQTPAAFAQWLANPPCTLWNVPAARCPLSLDEIDAKTTGPAKRLGLLDGAATFYGSPFDLYAAGST